MLSDLHLDSLSSNSQCNYSCYNKEGRSIGKEDEWGVFQEQRKFLFLVLKFRGTRVPQVLVYYIRRGMDTKRSWWSPGAEQVSWSGPVQSMQNLLPEASFLFHLSLKLFCLLRLQVPRSSRSHVTLQSSESWSPGPVPHPRNFRKCIC